MVWIVILPSLAIIVYLGNERHTNQRYALLIRFFLIIALSFYTAFWGTGTVDHDNYAKTYNAAINYDFTNLSVFGSDFLEIIVSEIGFEFLTILCNIIGFGELGFFFIIALFINTIVIHFIYKYPFPVLSVMFLMSMGFFILEANLIGQCLAMAILLPSFKFMCKENWWKFLLMIMFASLFHKSAFIFLIMIPVCFWGNDDKNRGLVFLFVVWLLSLTIGIGLFHIGILDIISRIMGLEYYDTLDNQVGTSVSIQRVIFFNFVAIWTFLKTYHKNVPLSVIVISSSIIMNLSMQYVNVSRLYYYYCVVDYVYVSYILSSTIYTKIRERNMLIPIRSVFILYCIVRLIIGYGLNSQFFDNTKPYTLDQFFR